MPILAMYFIGNSTRLRGPIQDHYGPFVYYWDRSSIILMTGSRLLQFNMLCSSKVRKIKIGVVVSNATVPIYFNRL